MVAGLTEEDIKVVAGGLFIIGLVVLGVSMLGCFGVYLENRGLMALVSSDTQKLTRIEKKKTS